MQLSETGRQGGTTQLPHKKHRWAIESQWSGVRAEAASSCEEDHLDLGMTCSGAAGTTDEPQSGNGAGI